MMYRVALQGFAESERSALAALLRQARPREPGYKVAPLSADADVIVADADSLQVVADVLDEARLATTLFVGKQRPPAATWHIAPPTDSAQLLRALDALVARRERDHATAHLNELDHAAHALAKAQAQRAARRARLESTGRADTAPALPPDILVLDRSAAERETLCALLEQFGFCAYPARDAAQALWLVETRAFRAAFLDIALDGTDDGVGLELCQRMRSGAAASTAPLFIVAAHASPVGRVRAALAGAQAFLVKPLGRGDVAQALESSGVALPADARRP